MVSQLSTDGEALRLFFTEDIYYVNEAPLNTPVIDRLPVTKTEAPLQVASAPVPVAEEDNTALDFKYLGKNKRNILILVNDEQNEVSTETGRELLRKIVKSVNLTAEDFALLNYAKYTQANFDQMKRFFNSSIVFAFGVSPSQLGLPNHPDNAIVHKGSVKFVFTAQLPELDQDANGKKALWACLRNLEL